MQQEHQQEINSVDSALAATTDIVNIHNVPVRDILGSDNNVANYISSSATEDDQETDARPMIFDSALKIVNMRPPISKSLEELKKSHSPHSHRHDSKKMERDTGPSMHAETQRLVQKEIFSSRTVASGVFTVDEPQPNSAAKKNPLMLLMEDIPEQDSNLVSLKAQILKSTDEESCPQVAKEAETSRRKIVYTFWFLFVMNFIRVFDNGILPALTTTLKEDYELSNLQIGTLGSLVYLGEVTGSLIAMPVYQKVPVKLVLLACIILQSVVIIGFALSRGSFEIMAVSRFLTGVFQVFISIFAPVWCDTHALAEKKTTWITALMVATPGGMVTGYLLTAMIVSFGAPW